MQTVPGGFNNIADGDVRPLSWGALISFTKQFDDDVTFFTLDQSVLNGVDILSTGEDNPIQAWDFYEYVDYTERIVNFSIHRELSFPNSVVSAIADFTLNNYDKYFTPLRYTRTVQYTNFSTNPSFENGNGTVEIRRNHVPNPSFRVDTSGWGLYTANGSPTIYNVSGVPWGRALGWNFSVDLPATSLVYRDLGAAFAGTKTLSYWIWQNSGSSVTFSARTGGADLGTTSVPTNTWTRVRATGTISVNGTVAMRNTTTIPAGTSVRVSGFLLEDTSADLPYFDGAYNEWQSADLAPSWTGSASNSASILSGVPPTNIYTNAPLRTWLSSDSPNHGRKFARSLVITDSDSAISPTDTSGIPSGDLRTSMLSIRSSAAIDVSMRWRTSSGTNFATAGSDESLAVNTWKEVVRSGSPATVNANLGIFLAATQISVGDIIDVDNHYSIAGSYSGEYFDGNSIDGGWEGSDNASISFLFEPYPPGIRQFVLPKRPVRLLAGFGSTLLPQFVGLTQGMPEISETDAIATFTAMDFLTQIYDMPIRETQALRDVRTDQVLEAIFTQFGLSPTQYDLGVGRNVVKFLFFEKDQLTAGDVIRPLMQAEGGMLWLDEQGIIRFRPRLEQPSEPIYMFDADNVVSCDVVDDDQIINHVIITTDVREVQEYQTVYSKKTTDTTLDVVPAGGTYIFKAELQDPQLSVEFPVYGNLADVSWFTAVQDNGSSVGSGVTIVSAELKTNTYEMTISNTNSFPVNINQMNLWGQPAKRISVEPIIYENLETESIDKYEDKTLEITNNFVQDVDAARSLALTILDEYSEYADVIEMEVKGNPALQLSDVIQLDYNQFDGEYRIIAITNKMQDGKFTQVLKCRGYNPRIYFQLDVSILNGSDTLAP